MAYLLDTNIVIKYLNASLPKAGMDFLNTIVDAEPMLSVITKMETLGFNYKTTKAKNTIETFINGSAILDINNEIVNKTIAIRKSKKIKLPDAIIAATAIIHNLTLITSDIDFENISVLQVIDPYNL